MTVNIRPVFNSLHLFSFIFKIQSVPQSFSIGNLEQKFSTTILIFLRGIPAAKDGIFFSF